MAEWPKLGLPKICPRDDNFALAGEDVGRIVNPLTLHGQAIGGMVQGLGGAFLEHLVSGVMQERARMRGKRVAVILSGGNIDGSIYHRILTGETPKVG